MTASASANGDAPRVVALAGGVGAARFLAGLVRVVDPARLTGHGSLYRVSPLEPGATPLLNGTIPGQPAEPVAWTHAFG